MGIRRSSQWGSGPTAHGVPRRLAIMKVMARTPSNTDLPLGALCPAFELTDVLTGTAMGRDDIFGGPDEERFDGACRQGLLVAFFSVHCPFVQHMEQAFTALAAKYVGSIAIVAICSNDAEAFPEDAPDKMKEQALRLGWNTIGDGISYLADTSQETAREFHAACTPDLYLFNKNYELTYHAQFDPTRPYRQSDANNGVIEDLRIHQPANGSDLAAAIEALLAHQPPIQQQVPSLGCNIKWR